MPPTLIGKPGAACAECGHAAGLHSNEACEAIRCACRITRKQLANGSATTTKAAPATAVVPVFPVADGAPEAPATKKTRKRRGGTHAA